MNDLSHITPDSPETQPHSIRKWSDIDTSTPDGLRELDRWIAPRFGWIVILKGNDLHLRSPRGQTYEICPVGFCGAIEQTLSSVWRNSHIPHYSTDANAALSLFVTDPDKKFPGLVYKYRPQIWCTPKGWHAIFQDELPSDVECGSIADTPALAICLAWLAYTDARPTSGDSEGGV